MVPGNFREGGAAALFGGSDTFGAVPVVAQGSAVPGVSVGAFVAGSLNPSATPSTLVGAAPSTLAGVPAFVSFRVSPLVVKAVAVIVGFPKS